MKQDLLKLYKEYLDYVDTFVVAEEQKHVRSNLGYFMEWIERGTVVEDNPWSE